MPSAADNYSAIIAKIHLHPHPNADALELGTIVGDGSQVVVRKGTHQEGELGVFLPAGGVLSDEFCLKNDLYPRLDADGKRINGGYIDPKNRRLRSINLRGEASQGMFLPLSCIAYTGIMPEEGTEFNNLKGHDICTKFYPATNKKAGSGGVGQKKTKKARRRELPTLLCHTDTQHLGRNLHRFDGRLDQFRVVITEKLHGTSHRFGNAFLPCDISWKTKLLTRLAQWFKIPTNDDAFGIWKHINGTRQVLLHEDVNRNSGYHVDQLRRTITANIDGLLHKGETIYGEIVGYDGNKPLFHQKVGHLTDKKLRTQLANHNDNVVEYSYGCQRGDAWFYVYRITQGNADGQVVYDYSWEAVVKRCEELGLETVPTLATFTTTRDASDTVLEVADQLKSGPSTLDASHIREGVCVRLEPNFAGGIALLPKIEIFKHKCHTFRMLEEGNDLIDLETLEDMES